MGGSKAVWVCLGYLAACALLASSAGAQPALKIEEGERVWELKGETPAGETVEHEFVLENAGTEPLEITEATPQSSYLTVVLPEEKIAPGEKGLLKAALNTEGLEPGAIETYIVVKSNDPALAEKPAVLTVKAHITTRPVTLLLVTPQEYDLGVVRVGEKKALTYTYQNPGTEPIEIYPLYFVDKRFTIVQDIEREVLTPGAPKEFKLTFEPEPGDAGQRLDAVFVVMTGSEKLPRLVCRVRRYVAPAEKKPEGVQIIPRFLGGESPHYFIQVLNNSAKTAEVVFMRAGEEIRRFVLRPEDRTGFDVQVASEEALSEIAVHVNLGHERPSPTEPAGEDAAGEDARSEEVRGETTDEGPPPDVEDAGESGPAETTTGDEAEEAGGTSDEPNGGSGTEPAGEGG